MPGATLSETLTGLLRTGLGEPTLTVTSVEPLRHGSDELDQAWRAEKYHTEGADGLEGLFPLDLLVRDHPGDVPRRMATMLKARQHDGLGTTLLPSWLDAAGVELPRPLTAYGTVAEFSQAGRREIAAYHLGTSHEAFQRFLPATLGDRIAADGRQCLLLIERVGDAVLMDSADDIVGWSVDWIGEMVDALGQLHAVGLTASEVCDAGPWSATPTRSATVLADAELFSALAASGHRNLPHLVTLEIMRQWDELIGTLGEWYPPKDALPRTVVHDDCNPRNVCFRRDGRPLLYDWELATVDLPQRDLAELLTFTLVPGVDRETVERLSERHRDALATAAGVEVDAEAWREGLRIQLRYEAINRIAWQWLFATQIELPYVSRVTATVSALVRLIG